MNKNLGWKLIVSIVVVLVFVYGIFGIPSGVSGGALADALFKESPFRHGISLGLDLRGGTHLILQVQVNDAVRAETENAVERLKEGMRTGKINYADVSLVDPVNDPSKVAVKGIPPES